MKHPLCRLRRLPPLLCEGDAPDDRGNPVHGCLRVACAAAASFRDVERQPDCAVTCNDCA